MRLAALPLPENLVAHLSKQKKNYDYANGKTAPVPAMTDTTAFQNRTEPTQSETLASTRKGTGKDLPYEFEYSSNGNVLIGDNSDIYTGTQLPGPGF